MQSISQDSQPKPPMGKSSDGAPIPRRIIVQAVAGLSLVSVLGYVLLMWLGQEAPETLANIAMTGIGILGGMAMPE